jgi:hypothetical protein
MLDSIKLMKKDINIICKLEKSSFLVLLYSFSMSSFIFNNNNSLAFQMISFATAYAVYGLVVSLVSNEEKKKTSLIFQSMPVRKRSTVIGKYLFSLVIIIFAACTSNILPLVKALMEKDISYLYLSFLNSLIFCIFIFSIFFPLFYSLGYSKMQPISLIIFYGLIFVPILLNFLKASDVIRPFANFTLDIINIVNSNLIISFTACILLYILSMLLSIKIENNL